MAGDRTAETAVRNPPPTFPVLGSHRAASPGRGFLGQPLLGAGFRLFFLLGALAGVLLIPAWLYAIQFGGEEVGFFSALEWHRHEMIFGFAGAIIAGFLLTAVPNWCGTPHRRGLPILLLGLLWLAGRLALWTPASLPWGVASGLDLAFLPALGLAIAPELVRARKVRNLKVLVVLAGMTVCNLLLHLGGLELGPDVSYRVTQIALDLVVLLMFVIGGRVIPYFTRKKLTVEILEPSGLPTLTNLSVLAVIVVDSVGSPASVRAGACLLAAILGTSRLARWQSRKVWRTPLLWSLNLGYGWLVLGMVAKAMGCLDPGFHPRLASHFFTVGGIGTLTLGMMSRVALGHTGRPIEASVATTFSFLLMNAGAVVRAFGPVFLPGWYVEALFASGAFWSAAFLVYLMTYAPILTSSRPDGREG